MKNIYFLSLFLILIFNKYSLSNSLKNFESNLKLECSSISFLGEEWKGNTQYIKLDTKISFALVQDFSSREKYWVVHKISKFDKDKIWLKKCVGGCMSNNENGSNDLFIDRMTGLMELKSKNSKKDNFIQMASWRCRKIKNKF